MTTTRQLERKLRREWAAKSPREKMLWWAHLRVAKSGHCWLRRCWGHYRIWRACRMDVTASIFKAIQFANKFRVKIYQSTKEEQQ
jgi:hypothetical protein